MKPLVLVVEDEASLATLLRYHLEKAGFAVRVATDGEDAMMLIEERRPDLILLDWMLPLISGIEICRQIRRRSLLRTVPVIMLTSRVEEGEKIRALDNGADDYMVKPFSSNELVARVRALLRRASLDADAVLSYGDLEMDLARFRVTRGGREVYLGPTEYRLLRHFLRSPGRVFTREQLLDAVWAHDVHVAPRTIDVHIRRLRKALNHGKDLDLIRTVREAGYALELPRLA